jgi:hypothetical protein
MTKLVMRNSKPTKIAKVMKGPKNFKRQQQCSHRILWAFVTMMKMSIHILKSRLVKNINKDPPQML